jgi:hypothetical protein
VLQFPVVELHEKLLRQVAEVQQTLAPLPASVQLFAVLPHCALFVHGWPGPFCATHCVPLQKLPVVHSLLVLLHEGP